MSRAGMIYTGARLSAEILHDLRLYASELSVTGPRQAYLRVCQILGHAPAAEAKP